MEGNGTADAANEKILEMMLLRRLFGEMRILRDDAAVRARHKQAAFGYTRSDKEILDEGYAREAAGCLLGGTLGIQGHKVPVRGTPTSRCHAMCIPSLH